MSTERKLRKFIKGGARIKTFSNGGSIINIDLLMEDLLKLPINKSGYIKISLSENRNKEQDKFGNDYSIFQNEFVPNTYLLEKNKEEEKAKAISNQILKPRNTDQLPF